VAHSGLASQRGLEPGYVQPDFVNAGDQHAQVVGNYLAQNLIDLAGVGL
jgi:hypothetical protein